MKGEEEEKRRAAQEAARKAEEDARNEEEERKMKLDEELQKHEAERMKLTQIATEQSASDTADIQTQDVENPDVQDLDVPAISPPGQSMAPTLKLVPFEQKIGEEVPNFNTIFYDRVRKRIVKRTEKKVETGGLSGKMITDTTIVYRTDQDPRFTIRVGAALIHALEDNVDKIMTYLEQSRKSSSQLKDTLRKEREENSKLKRKFEEVQREMNSSKDEFQVL